MLYLGHFSFESIEGEGIEHHGYFTCVVQAGSPELALQKFRKRIYDLREEIDALIFETIEAVYVEDIVELDENPEKAVVTRFQSSDSPFPKSITWSLPNADARPVKAHQWIPESEPFGNKFERENIFNGRRDALPFVRF